MDVEASNYLTNRGVFLSRVPELETGAPQYAPAHRPATNVSGFAEVTRRRRASALGDAGKGFMESRLESEVYPIPGPICLDVMVGESSRMQGRDPLIMN